MYVCVFVYTRLVTQPDLRYNKLSKRTEDHHPLVKPNGRNYVSIVYKSRPVVHIILMRNTNTLGLKI